MPRALKESDSNLPFHTPVYKWRKQTVEPAPSHIAATLGPRPGNTLKPPPNNFFLTKWTALDQRAEFADERKKDFQFFSVENQVDEEPEVIAGIDLNEIIKKPAEKAAVASGSPSKAAPASPTKAVASPSKSALLVAPVSPSKVAPSASPLKVTAQGSPSKTMPVSPSKAPLSPAKGPASPQKPLGSLHNPGSPAKPGSPPKPSANSPKDTIMHPPSPSKPQK